LRSYQYSNYSAVRPPMLNKTRLAAFMHNNCGANSKRQEVGATAGALAGAWP
jgi:hypothetical protein